jgi:mRNA-degrading endonuclease RelE of RelBE toxin-antitoxin system
LLNTSDFLKLSKWKLSFKPGWDIYFKKFDNSIQKKILKKFNQMKESLQARGLHNTKILVEEIGQYRIAFIKNEENKTKLIHFIGNHKQYEKWYQKK